MSEFVAAVIVLRHDGAALLQLRDDRPDIRHPGVWVPPGGHSESDESMLCCAKRELLEETGYECPEARFLVSFEDRVEGWPAYTLTIFWCAYDGTQPVTCREGQALAFIERYRAGNYPIPPYVINAWDAAIAALRTTSAKEIS